MRKVGRKAGGSGRLQACERRCSLPPHLRALAGLRVPPLDHSQGLLILGLLAGVLLRKGEKRAGFRRA